MSANWNHFLKWADLWAGSITDGREDYKTLIVDRVKEAREAFTSGGDWKPLLKKSFFTDNNLLHWHPRSTLFSWLCNDTNSPQALKRLWSDGDLENRINRFINDIPSDVIKGFESKLTATSFLLMSEGSGEEVVIYRSTVAEKCAILTGIERNKSLQDFSCYKWYLDFLDSFIQIKSSGFLIQNRLHAQSIAYSIVKENPPDEWDKSQKEEFLLWRDGHLSDLLEEESTLGDSFDILSIEDRIKALRYIRRGQDKFRKSVFDAYKGRCAITGCTIKEVLDAAHIEPFNVKNHKQDNGILLRKDIHALFDAGLLWIDPETKLVVLEPSVQDEEYMKLAGKKVSLHGGKESVKYLLKKVESLKARKSQG